MVVGLFFLIVSLGVGGFLEVSLWVGGVSMVLLVMSFLKNWFHAIMMMMLLELAMLMVFFLLMEVSVQILASSGVFIVSTFMVIEASLGMSILTLMVRSHGNDFILVFLGGGISALAFSASQGVFP